MNVDRVLGTGEGTAVHMIHDVHTGTVCARAGERADALAAQHGAGVGGECAGTADPGEPVAANQHGTKPQPTFGGECECPGVAPVEAGPQRNNVKAAGWW